MSTQEAQEYYNNRSKYLGIKPHPDGWIVRQRDVVGTLAEAVEVRDNL